MERAYVVYILAPKATTDYCCTAGSLYSATCSSQPRLQLCWATTVKLWIVVACSVNLLEIRLNAETTLIVRAHSNAMGAPESLGTETCHLENRIREIDSVFYIIQYIHVLRSLCYSFLKQFFFVCSAFIINQCCNMHPKILYLMYHPHT